MKRLQLAFGNLLMLIGAAISLWFVMAMQDQWRGAEKAWFSAMFLGCAALCMVVVLASYKPAE